MGQEDRREAGGIRRDKTGTDRQTASRIGNRTASHTTSRIGSRTGSKAVMADPDSGP